jgi:hypothetical protein
MNTATLTQKDKRVNFLAPKKLIIRATQLAKERNSSFSELTREALENHVTRIEQEKVDRELAEACEKSRTFNKQFSSEWAKFETRI